MNLARNIIKPVSEFIPLVSSYLSQIRTKNNSVAID